MHNWSTVVATQYLISWPPSCLVLPDKSRACENVGTTAVTAQKYCPPPRPQNTTEKQKVPNSHRILHLMAGNNNKNVVPSRITRCKHSSVYRPSPYDPPCPSRAQTQCTVPIPFSTTMFCSSNSRHASPRYSMAGKSYQRPCSVYGMC